MHQVPVPAIRHPSDLHRLRPREIRRCTSRRSPSNTASTSTRCLASWAATPSDSSCQSRRWTLVISSKSRPTIGRGIGRVERRGHGERPCRNRNRRADRNGRFFARRRETDGDIHPHETTVERRMDHGPTSQAVSKLEHISRGVVATDEAAASEEGALHRHHNGLTTAATCFRISSSCTSRHMPITSAPKRRRMTAPAVVR